MQNLMVFEGHDVEVFELNGQVLFNPYHVAEILDIKNVRDNIARMNAKQVVKLTNSKVGERPRPAQRDNHRRTDTQRRGCGSYG